MVVNILVYIESSEYVEHVAKVSFPRDGPITPEDWERVCGTNYGVDMYNGHDSIPVNIKIRFNDPHPIVGVWVIKGFAEVMDKRTQKNLIPKLEREK